MRGATVVSAVRYKNLTYFNPRAPCGARLDRDTNNSTLILISTHAPLAGRDLNLSEMSLWSMSFQPTRPLRGATHIQDVILYLGSISTHAPLAGRDGVDRYGYSNDDEEFQPTRPLRGATEGIVVNNKGHLIISTHAPLAGRDSSY